MAELRCGTGRKDDDELDEEHLVALSKCLFSIIETIMSSELLTRSKTGRTFLELILKQITDGDRGDYGSDAPRRRRSSSSDLDKMFKHVANDVSEIVIGAYTGDLEFAMDGVNCIQSIVDCSKRFSDATPKVEAAKEDDDDESASSLHAKLSEVAGKLLMQSWPEETKMNKSNIGKLLSLFVEHSGKRMETLSHLMEDVLKEVPSLDKNEFVPAYPTCTQQTFGSYHAIVIEYLSKELVSLFDAKLSPDIVFRQMKQLIGNLQFLLDLAKEHDSIAKKNILLQQLKFGSRFVENFVSKAIPYFQVKGRFEQYQETILDIIQLLQNVSRQLSNIISKGKRDKIAILAKETPRAKKANETFIHKVKALLKKNRCMTAMGKCLISLLCVVLMSVC